MSVKTKYIKDLPLKNDLDGTETLIVEDNEATKQAPLGTIVDEIKQNSQEKIREIESELNQTNAQLSELANRGTTVEVLERVTKAEIDRQVADGTIANLIIADGSITEEKLDPNLKFGVQINDDSISDEETFSSNKITSEIIKQVDDSLYDDLKYLEYIGNEIKIVNEDLERARIKVNKIEPLSVPNLSELLKIYNPKNKKYEYVITSTDGERTNNGIISLRYPLGMTTKGYRASDLLYKEDGVYKINRQTAILRIPLKSKITSSIINDSLNKINFKITSKSLGQDLAFVEGSGQNNLGLSDVDNVNSWQVGVSVGDGVIITLDKSTVNGLTGQDAFDYWCDTLSVDEIVVFGALTLKTRFTEIVQISSLPFSYKKTTNITINSDNLTLTCLVGFRENKVAVIDDSTFKEDATWSSSKIALEISKNETNDRKDYVGNSISIFNDKLLEKNIVIKELNPIDDTKLSQLNSIFDSSINKYVYEITSTSEGKENKINFALEQPIVKVSKGYHGADKLYFDSDNEKFVVSKETACVKIPLKTKIVYSSENTSLGRINFRIRLTALGYSNNIGFVEGSCQNNIGMEDLTTANNFDVGISCGTDVVITVNKSDVNGLTGQDAFDYWCDTLSVDEIVVFGALQVAKRHQITLSSSEYTSPLNSYKEKTNINVNDENISLTCSVAFENSNKLGAGSLSDRNGKVPLFVETYYDGDNQPLHPKVVAFKDAWNGYKYWMAYTPYPRDEEENPSIAVSNDLLKWVTPQGLQNPLDNPTDAEINYWSDTHLLYREDLNRLEIWYRGFKTGEPIIIARKCSTDGVTWGDREIMWRGGGVSPVIIWEDSKYKIWDGVNNSIEHYESTDGKNKTLIGTCTYNNEKISNWHFDVERTDKGYELVLCTEMYGGEIQHFVSTDGLVFNEKKTLISRCVKGNLDSDRVYRPCLLKEDGIYYLFYSGKQASLGHGDRWNLTLSIATEKDNIESIRGIGAEVLPYQATYTIRPKYKYEGFSMWDSSLKKQIWWNGTAWIDACGNRV